MKQPDEAAMFWTDLNLSRTAPTRPNRLSLTHSDSVDLSFPPPNTFLTNSIQWLMTKFNSHHLTPAHKVCEMVNQ